MDKLRGALRAAFDFLLGGLGLGGMTVGIVAAYWVRGG